MSNNPLDFVSGIIRQYSLRLRRIIVKYHQKKVGRTEREGPERHLFAKSGARDKGLEAKAHLFLLVLLDSNNSERFSLLITISLLCLLSKIPGD